VSPRSSSIAKRWAHEYPGQHDLPEHVSDKKKKREKAAFFSTFLTLFKGAAYQLQTGLGKGLPARAALRPAGPPQGSGMALPKANPLTMVGTHQNAHQQPGAPTAPGQLQNPSQNPSLQPTNTPAGSMDIQSLLARHANQLLNTPANKGQTMPPKNASALPSPLQALCGLTSGNQGNQPTNSAGTLLEKAASAVRQVLEKCAFLKQALPYQQQPHGFRPMGGQGSPQRGQYRYLLGHPQPRRSLDVGAQDWLKKKVD